MNIFKMNTNICDLGWKKDSSNYHTSFRYLCKQQNYTEIRCSLLTLAKKKLKQTTVVEKVSIYSRRQNFFFPKIQNKYNLEFQESFVVNYVNARKFNQFCSRKQKKSKQTVRKESMNQRKQPNTDVFLKKT